MTTHRVRITALVVSVQYSFWGRCKLGEKFASGQRLKVALVFPTCFSSMNGGYVKFAESFWKFSNYNYILEMNLHSSCWNNKDMQISVWDLDVWWIFLLFRGIMSLFWPIGWAWYITQSRQDQTRSEVQVRGIAELLRANALQFRSTVCKGTCQNPS